MAWGIRSRSRSLGSSAAAREGRSAHRRNRELDDCPAGPRSCAGMIPRYVSGALALFATSFASTHAYANESVAVSSCDALEPSRFWTSLEAICAEKGRLESLAPQGAVTTEVLSEVKSYCSMAADAKR